MRGRCFSPDHCEFVSGTLRRERCTGASLGEAGCQPTVLICRPAFCQPSLQITLFRPSSFWKIKKGKTTLIACSGTARGSWTEAVSPGRASCFSPTHPFLTHLATGPLCVLNKDQFVMWNRKAWSPLPGVIAGNMGIEWLKPHLSDRNSAFHFSVARIYLQEKRGKFLRFHSIWISTSSLFGYPRAFYLQ